MKAQVFVALLALVFVTNSTIVSYPVDPKPPVPVLPITPKCGSNEVYTTDRGCIRSCADPEFQKCKDLFFAAVVDWKFCGYRKDGTHASATYDCEICGTYPNTEFIGVSQGICDGDINPSPGPVVDPTPVPPKCKDLEVYVEGPGCIKSCLNPQFAKCKDLSFIAIYDPKFCGYRADGTKQSLTYTCEACGLYPNPSYVGYTDGECSDIAPVDPNVGKCKVDADCLENENCDNGFCFNRCAATLCPENTNCWKGECIPLDGCAIDKQCATNQFCWKNKCVLREQKCGTGVCPADQKCVYNKCLPVPIDKCALIRCKSGFQCKDGQCVPIDKCALVKCKAGTECQDGICVPVCGKCAPYEFCNNGKCLDKCAYMRCSSGGCYQGQCTPPPCDNKCTKDQKCVKGECVSAFPVCKVDKECKQPEICLESACFNICKTTKCAGGHICVHGKCIPEVKYCKTAADCGEFEKCYSGVCKNKCLNVKCQPGYKCDEGACIKTKCWNVTCAADEFCNEGKCQRTVAACPAKAPYNAITCTNPRPTQKECPVLYYIIAPAPLYCGVNAKGERFDFPRDCEACKDKSIVYYFDKPCHKVPFVCGEKETCNGEYCVKEGCKADEECPYDWQRCWDNKCVDKCNFLRCASCKFGRCLYEAPSGECKLQDSDCKRDYWSCVGFECVDLCERKACGPYEVCKRGQCESTIVPPY